VSGTLELRNRQREKKIDLRLLKRIVGFFLGELANSDGKVAQFSSYELGVHLVGTAEIERLNETWLQHEGPTDVITFDYNDPARPQMLAGEILVCVSEAIGQAKQFGTSWQSEVVRYIVHGILHLGGFDDQTAKKKRAMKRFENHWVKFLSREFDFRTVANLGGKARRDGRK
jgi:rRNA maturation RNase YbeY